MGLISAARSAVFPVAPSRIYKNPDSLLHSECTDHSPPLLSPPIIHLLIPQLVRSDVLFRGFHGVTTESQVETGRLCAASLQVGAAARTACMIPLDFSKEGSEASPASRRAAQGQQRARRGARRVSYL